VTITAAIPAAPALYTGADALPNSPESVFLGNDAIGLVFALRNAEGGSHPIMLSPSDRSAPGDFQASWAGAIGSLVAATNQPAQSGRDAEGTMRSLDPGPQRTAGSGDASGAATTKREMQERVGKMKGEFALWGESIRNTAASAHQVDHVKKSRLADGRSKQIDSHEECEVAKADRKPAMEAPSIAVAHVSTQPSPVRLTSSNDIRCERSAQNLSAAATGALREAGAGQSTAHPPASRVNMFIGAKAGVFHGTAEESATQTEASDEFVDGSSKADTDHDAVKLIDSRSAPGSEGSPEGNQATPIGKPVSPVDVSRREAPAASELSSAPVLQPVQSSGRGATPKDASGPLFNSRTIQSGARVGASTGFASEKRPLSIAAQGGMRPVPVRDVVAGNGSGDQSAASAVGSARGPVNDSNGRMVDDPFAAIDAGRSPGTTTWIHAGSRHAEAGYLDPSFGWVGVRADLSGSGIHAAVVPASVEAAQALGGHLPGLSSYIAEHHGQTATVTLAPPQSRSDGAGMDRHSGSGGAAAERHSAGSDSEGSRRAEAVKQTGGRSLRSAEPIPEAVTSSRQGSARAGTYVSVMA